MVDDEILTLITIANEASDAIMAVYKAGSPQIRIKDNKTPVTEADILSHNIIVARLKEYNALPVLSEEEVELPFVERQKWQRYWLVDPLDGTRDFIKQTDEFSINIALIDGHRAVLGLVFSPVTRIAYYARAEQGAYIRDTSGNIQPLQTKPWDLSHPLRILGSRHHKGTALASIIKQFANVEAKGMGSALKFGVVAAAEADFYPRLGLTSEWDTAAGQCILEEAGGAVVDLDDKPLAYNTKDSLLNPHFVAVGDLETYLALRGKHHGKESS